MSSTFTNYVFDTEQTGANTHAHSMHWLGVVKLTRDLNTTFEGKMRPRPGTSFHPEAMTHAGNVTWEEILSWPDPAQVMPQFGVWLRSTLEPGTIPLFWADNNGHDKKWLDIYMSQFGEESLTGHTSRNIMDIFRGFKMGRKAAGKPLPRKFQHLKRLADTPHDHTPVNDSKGLCEALIKLHDNVGFPINIH
tara:strand:+ start:295 stop:870 length:576 start_codon:yes stop_codon:yes gene_type:complete